MSFLRALRAYIGLGPDEDIEDRYLYELNSRRRELDLDELDAEAREFGDDGSSDLEIDADDVVIVTPGASRTSAGRTRPRRSEIPDRGERPPRIDRKRADFRNESHRANRSGRLPAADFIDDFDLDEELGHVGGVSAFEDDDADGLADGVADGVDLDVIDGSGGQGDEGILDFLEDETFTEAPTDDSPSRTGGKAGRSERRDSARTGSRTRSDRSEPEAEESFPKAVVRSLDSMRAKPRTLIPESFADAKLVADEFKRDIPVLLNLQGLERDLARRLIDFASGICYAMDGSMEKIASQVFLLIPESVEVSDEDRRRIEERGYAR